MESIKDKCYHLICAIPVVQTVVGGAFAVKDIIGIIKDIAMTYIFTDYDKKTNITLKDIECKIKNISDMYKSYKILYVHGLTGTKENKDLAIEGMQSIQRRLEINGLLFPLSDHAKSIYSNNCPFTQESSYTKAYIDRADLRCKSEENMLKFDLNLTRAVPAKIRLYNLATNIISMIPTYRIGTLFNLATLGYHFIVKY